MKTTLFAAAVALGLFATSASAQIPKAPPIVISDPAPDGVRVDANGVFGNYFAAKTPGRHAGVLVLGGSEGGLGKGAMREATELQKEGFDVLQLSYFGAPGEPAMLVGVPLETFTRGLAYLRAQPGVDPRRIGILGGSKGGEAVLIVAAREPGIKAVVSTMPSSVSWPGINYAPTMSPSWTVEGKPLPYLPYAFGPSTHSVFDIYNDGLKAVDANPEAVIPVEKITGAIMLVCGEADTLWPSCPMSDQIAARLKAKGRPAPIILRYADAGHAVFGPPVDKSSPYYASLGSLGGSPEGNAAARNDDWPRAVAFLKSKLGE